MNGIGEFIMILITVIFILSIVSVYGEEMKPVKLPDPLMEGGKPLMEVLRDRHSSREFSDKELPEQVLSNLLWAAFGINRPESGKRTAPSARNWQETDIYLAMKSGLYLYEPKTHSLIPIIGEDIRANTGSQDFVAEAPINLIYVADYSRMGEGSVGNQDFYSAVATGFISQNVYLFCTSEGLATVVRGSVDRDSLRKIMKLKPEQKITLSQTVGYPN